MGPLLVAPNHLRDKYIKRGNIMSDMKKLIDIVAENTVSGVIATGGFAPYSKKVGETLRRTAETDEAEKPKIIEYGNWENSALVAGDKMIKKRSHEPKLVKSVYGEDQATKKKVSESAHKEIAEEKIEEQDLIINPSAIVKKARDLVAKDRSRVDHEVEMAKGDLYQAGKNALQIFAMLKHISEEEGLEGWVQEKIIKAADYLNVVREYLESKRLDDSIDGVSPSTKMFTSENKKLCPECSGPIFESSLMNEKKDACYYKVKSRYKVWPSAYASGALVKCRKKGAKNWGTKSESIMNEADPSAMASKGGFEIRTSSGDEEGNVIYVFKDGKEIASGDFDRWAGKYFLYDPHSRSDKTFDTREEILDYFIRAERFVDKREEPKYTIVNPERRPAPKSSTTSNNVSGSEWLLSSK